MRRCRPAREVLLVAVAALTMTAVVCGCPLGLVTNAQMAPMMGSDMGTQGVDGMCPMLCGVPPSPPSADVNGFLFGPLPVPLALIPASKVRTIFHPPTFA
jgi:hypothetical protein